MRALLRQLRAAAAASLIAFGIAGAAAAQTVTMPVPLATIYPGDPIGESAIGERTFQQALVANGFVDSRSQLIGKVARRTLLPGHPIAINAISDLNLVNRGTPVQVVFQHAGLVITAYAAPLQDGSEGDLIRVRNVDSGAVIVGIVQADGSVRVGPQ